MQNNIDKPLEALLELVARTYGSVPNTPADFESLSESIFCCTHNNISTSTLKRLWGYVGDKPTPRAATLDVLCQYVGIRSWQTFTDKVAGKNQQIESNVILGDYIDAYNIKEGEQLRLAWNPDRMCVFESRGNGQFVVTESNGSKLSVGDTFKCHTVIPGEPLFLYEVKMQGRETLVTYVCGRENGVTII